MAHPDEDLARQGYKAFAGSDMATLDTLMADDVQWHVAGGSVISGDYDGKTGRIRVFRQLSDRSEETYSLDIHDIVANDNHTSHSSRAVASVTGGDSRTITFTSCNRGR